jgi:hypothetical protein
MFHVLLQCPVMYFNCILFSTIVGCVHSCVAHLHVRIQCLIYQARHAPP